MSEKRTVNRRTVRAITTIMLIAVLIFSLTAFTYSWYKNYVDVSGAKFKTAKMSLEINGYSVDSSHNVTSIDPILINKETEDSITVNGETVKVNTWNKKDGFTETETVVSRTPVTEKQLVRMLRMEKAFPRYKKVQVRDKKLPVYSVISVLLCMAVLLLPVFLSVICNEVEVQNKEYDAYIKDLNDEIKELEVQVALKKDMQLIDSLARDEYGMIDAELSQINRVSSAEDSFVLENTEPEEEKSVWVILLSAIGIID